MSSIQEKIYLGCKVLLMTSVLQGTTAMAGTGYELIKISVDQRRIQRCILTQNALVMQTEVGGIHTKRSVPIETDSLQVQGLVDKVGSLDRPDFTKFGKYTEWLVKSDSTSKPKTIRTNLGGQIYEANGSNVLTTYMGYNCSFEFD